MIFVVDDPGALGGLERELLERYSRHYRIESAASPDEARRRLEALAGAEEEVAVVLAGHRFDGLSGSEVLDVARRHHPHSRRALLIAWGEWGDRKTGQEIFRGFSDGRIDNFLSRPSEPPDEVFHHTVSGLLSEWAEARRSLPYTVQVVGESWSGRAYELRAALERCAIPHSFCLADSEEGRSLVAQAGDDIELPLLVLPDGGILRNPTNAELALAAGGPVDLLRTEFDVIIVGAGPAGLSAAVYGASEGFSTLVIDEGGIGGQATSSSLIRNYLGFPHGVSGRRLAQSAYGQAWVFGANFLFMHRVTQLRREGDELAVALPDGRIVRTRAVILAAGATYRRLAVPELEALNGAGVFYGGAASEAPAVTGKDVYILGGANSAGQAALHLARYARSVTIVIRAPSLDAGMSSYLVREVEATPNVDVRVETEVIGGGGDGHLEHLVLADRGKDTTTTVNADALFIMIGASPNTGWLPSDVQRDDDGFVLTGSDVVRHGGWPLDRAPFILETSMPRVFAAGDVRQASVKRVASAVGEGSVAIQLLHSLFELEHLHPRGRPDQPDSWVDN